MPQSAGTHPDHGCHHELHTADGTVLHACAERWMEPIAAVAAVTELPDPPDPPIDLLVAMERRRLAQVAARRARRHNRQVSGGGL